MLSSTETLIHFAPEKGHGSEIITVPNASSGELSLVLKTDTELSKKEKAWIDLLRCRDCLGHAVYKRHLVGSVMSSCIS